MRRRRPRSLPPARARRPATRAWREQKRYDTYEPAALWPDGTAARPLPEGVVAHGDLARAAAAATAAAGDAGAAARAGRSAIGIFCAPCHGLAGDGDGMIVQRGFPHPPSYHTARLRAAPAQLLLRRHHQRLRRDVRLRAPAWQPADRWAIVAYIRALQLARHATLAEVPEARERLP